MKALFVAASALLLAGCAAKPQQTMLDLSSADPKFKSAECVDIRNRALEYDDKIGTRMAIGFASGLLLGPFGLPIAASADAAQNTEREAFNRELQIRCMTNPPPRPAPPPPTQPEQL